MFSITEERKLRAQAQSSLYLLQEAINMVVFHLEQHNISSNIEAVRYAQSASHDLAEVQQALAKLVRR